MKKVLITGVTGAQGNGIAKIFTRAGHEVLSISREKNKTNEFAKILDGDLEDYSSFANKIKELDVIVLTLPLLFDPKIIATMTNNIIKLAKEKNVQKIIFNTSIAFGENSQSVLAIDVKRAAYKLLEESKIKLVTLMPTIYLDNLSSEFLLPVIKENNILPYPIASDFRFAWISYENLGRFCLKALDNDEIIGKKILITNKEKVTGDELAQLIGKKIAKNLPYISSTPDEFEQNLKPVLGDYVAKEISDLYRAIENGREYFLNYSFDSFINSVELETTQEWADKFPL